MVRQVIFSFFMLQMDIMYILCHLFVIYLTHGVDVVCQKYSASTDKNSGD